jgi:hypothetical protein
VRGETIRTVRRHDSLPGGSVLRLVVPNPYISSVVDGDKEREYIACGRIVHRCVGTEGASHYRTSGGSEAPAEEGQARAAPTCSASSGPSSKRGPNRRASGQTTAKNAGHS